MKADKRIIIIQIFISKRLTLKIKSTSKEMNKGAMINVIKYSDNYFNSIVVERISYIESYCSFCAKNEPAMKKCNLF